MQSRPSPLQFKGNMKKFIAKVSGKKQPQEPAGRITTDTLAEHREKVLAGGRKFKYPVQYQRHKLVINAAIISLASLLVLVGLGWYLLYPAQNTSEFMYRVTKVIPVPVAVVDGQQVRYSDYLMQYRSNLHYLVEKEQVDITTENGKRQLDFIKSQSMEGAIANAFAVKKARELDIQVTDAELETFLTQQRQVTDGEVSEATYNSVIEDYYGWSADEYRDAMKSKLLRQKVAFALDENATKITETVEQRVKAGQTNLAALAEELNKEEQGVLMFTPAAWVPRDNRDGGLAKAASDLQKGQISAAVKTTTGDGYHYVQLIDSNEDNVQFVSLYIPLTEFKDQLKAAQEDNKLTKFISVEVLSAQQ